MSRRTTFLVLTALLAGCGPTASDPDTTGMGAGGAPSWVAPSRAVSQAPKPAPPKIAYPDEGGGEYRTAAAQKSSPPGKGTVLRYRVLVERDIEGVTPGEFARSVQQTLDDPRGWTAEGTRRLRRAGPGQPYDFTIYLVTPATRDKLCQDVPDGYTSCRNGNRVVLNVARWADGVPGYGAPLAVYRQYMVNHEVGHRLGHGHERCPGKGRPAPVMQQQTLGMHGCRPNPWPYLDGERYAGPSGAYDDPVPGR
jgi:hypothetical protein